MLALNVSIPCESRGLPSCEVARRGGLLRKSCNKRACHRVVPATWERGVKGTHVMWSEMADLVFWRLPSCCLLFYFCLYTSRGPEFSV